LTKVIVYTKQGCHLCERVMAELGELRKERHLEISTLDITSNQELFQRYKDIIPVVSVDGEVKLGGSILANPNTLNMVLRKALPPS